jgi:hypothetical protein
MDDTYLDGLIFDKQMEEPRMYKLLNQRIGCLTGTSLQRGTKVKEDLSDRHRLAHPITTDNYHAPAAFTHHGLLLFVARMPRTTYLLLHFQGGIKGGHTVALNNPVTWAMNDKNKPQ